MKPFPRFTPAPTAAPSGVDGASHDPYLPHPRRLHGWSQLPNRVHLGRGFRLKGRITHTNQPRPHSG
jgi:hypothetical protein